MTDKLSYEKKQEIRKTLEGLKISTGLQIYSEIDTELRNLWAMRDLCETLFEPLPTQDIKNYPTQSIENRVKARLDNTKKLMEMLK